VRFFGIFGFFSFVIWFFILLALAIMFDWLGARDIVKSGLSNAEEIVEYLERVGDESSGLVDSLQGEETAMDKLKDTVN